MPRVLPVPGHVVGEFNVIAGRHGFAPAKSSRRHRSSANRFSRGASMPPSLYKTHDISRYRLSPPSISIARRTGKRRDRIEIKSKNSRSTRAGQFSVRMHALLLFSLLAFVIRFFLFSLFPSFFSR
jgi:hypothetical protein